MKQKAMSEQEAAALVVAYLEECGLDVYQEVGLSGKVIDIVATRGKEVWAVEVKTSWSLDLLQQCMDHQGLGHVSRVFAAVPMCRGWRDRARMFRRIGIGTIEIHEGCSWQEPYAKVDAMAPRITNRDRREILHTLGILCEGHKTHAKAGAPSAKGRFTPFRATCNALRDAVRVAPGKPMSTYIKAISHHYSSDACARGSLTKWIQAGRIPGLRIEQSGKTALLFPEEAASA